MGKVTLYLALRLSRSIEMIIEPFAAVKEEPLNFEKGMVGAMFVYDTRENAEANNPDTTIIEIETRNEQA